MSCISVSGATEYASSAHTVVGTRLVSMTSASSRDTTRFFMSLSPSLCSIFCVRCKKADGKRPTISFRPTMEGRRRMPSRLDKKTVPILRGNRRAFLRKKRRFCNAKTAWFLHKQSHTERTPAVPDPPTCNSPASRRGALAPRLPPTFSGLRPMADFRHTAFAVSVHPCAHSAVRSRFCPISF